MLSRRHYNPNHQPSQLTTLFFFLNDTATTEIYTLSLHAALPIWGSLFWFVSATSQVGIRGLSGLPGRSEEHTSELQSRQYLVCRLLLEKTNLQYRSQRRLRYRNQPGKTLAAYRANHSLADRVRLRRSLFFLKHGQPPRLTLFPHTPLFQ